MIATIAELPFHERPLLDLLHVATDRPAPDPEYGGFGWARASRLWLVAPGSPASPVEDALVLALHGPDDGEVWASDLELYFELPDQDPVTVLASAFLARWLPRLPQDASAIVLALCNPHRASLSPPAGTRAPWHLADGDVESWRARDGERIELRAAAWRHLPGPTDAHEGGVFA